MDESVESGSATSGRRPKKDGDHRFSIRQFFRDIRQFGQRRTRRSGRHKNSLVVSNSGMSQVEEDEAASESVTALIECPICTYPQPSSSFPRLANAQCRHLSCADCLQLYLTLEITESRTDIACLVCSVLLHPNDIRQFLGPESEIVKKYDEFTLRRALVVDPDVRWCPAPDCGYAVIASGCAGCPKLQCGRPGCGTMFCYHCKQAWHANQTCSSARAKRMSSVHSLLSINHSSADSTLSSGTANDVKACPRCSALIVKMDDGSCNHMTCTVCGAEFCWLCMQEISDIHYLSPSGCTFWGKKPWSRKKKILLQLAMLVGGPIGISLIAIAAIPTIMIGYPVWVGRKLYRKFSKMSKHRRNLIVVSSVLASIIVSPIISIVSVVIGVPLLLAYVYGIVPVSLCRSIGNCGLKTTASGVRINFDDDDDVNSPSAVLARGPFQSTNNIVSSDPEFSQLSDPGGAGSLRLAKSYGGDSDGQLASVGVDGSTDAVGGGFQRKLTLDRILTRQVRAEVSFNPAGSSRRSLGEGSSNGHCNGGGTASASKSRSAATVSFSDIISTSQEGTRGHFLKPEPSSITRGSNPSLGGRSVSVVGPSSLGLRSASVAGPGASSFLPRSIVAHSSTFRSASPPPLTKRSVSFVRDHSSGTDLSRRDARAAGAAVAPCPAAASWSYKRQCMSVGDSIDERVESTATSDYLSVRSLATTSAQKLEPGVAGSDLVAMVEADEFDAALPPVNGPVRLVPGYQRGAVSGGGVPSTSSNLASASGFLSDDEDLQRFSSADEILPSFGECSRFLDAAVAAADVGSNVV